MRLLWLSSRSVEDILLLLLLLLGLLRHSEGRRAALAEEGRRILWLLDSEQALLLRLLRWQSEEARLLWLAEERARGRCGPRDS